MSKQFSMGDDEYEGNETVIQNDSYIETSVANGNIHINENLVANGNIQINDVSVTNGNIPKSSSDDICSSDSDSSDISHIAEDIRSHEPQSKAQITALKLKLDERNRSKHRTRNMSFCCSDEFQNCHSCTQLYHTKRHLIPLKNYHDEARAMKDIEKFLKHPVVLLKVHHTNWEGIIKEMIKTLAEEKPDLKLNVHACVRELTNKEADYAVPESIRAVKQSENGPVTETSFVTVLGKVGSLPEVQVVIAVLAKPFNFGKSTEEIRFICVVLSGAKGKHTKSAIEVGRSYATLLADERLRASLISSHTPKEFASKLELGVHRIHKEHEVNERSSMVKNFEIDSQSASAKKRMLKFIPGVDMADDFKRRVKFYYHDYFGDLKSCASIQKIFSTILFLYSSILLPGIAFGILDHFYTKGRIDPKSVIVSQALAGFLFSTFGGQPLVIVMTTIPIVIYTKILYIISNNWGDDGSFFYTFYAMTGIANAFFMIIYAVTGASKIMRLCSRSTEEIVGLFVAMAFVVDTVKYIAQQFSQYYCFDNGGTVNITKRAAAADLVSKCEPLQPILTLLIILITVYIGVQINNFKHSPFLNNAKRVAVASYALVLSVIIGTLIGSLAFKDIPLQKFQVDENRPLFQLVTFEHPPIAAVFTSIALGFAMSILFFMENNVSASIVNNPANNLKKGTAFHLDMFVTAIINLILSLFALPWIHGMLPHSPLHVRALADIEEHQENGHMVDKVVYVRETRITFFITSIMIGVSVLMVPYPLNIVPIPVFYGIFVFLAITSLDEFQMWERLILIFTEQNLYPPKHYVRRVPQKIIHCFTLLQLVQLAVLCIISFVGSAYMKMFFPFVILILIPIREKVLPLIISEKHLNVLDGVH